MKYLELTTKVIEWYIMIMLFLCAILLGVLVYNTSYLPSLTDQLVRLDLVETVYGEN